MTCAPSIGFFFRTSTGKQMKSSQVGMSASRDVNLIFLFLDVYVVISKLIDQSGLSKMTVLQLTIKKYKFKQISS
jgi:hypothetical protein